MSDMTLESIDTKTFENIDYNSMKNDLKTIQSIVI